MMIMKINNDIKESAFFGGDDRALWDHGFWLDSNKEEDFAAGWTGIFVIEAEGVTHTYIVEDWYGLSENLGIVDQDPSTQEIKLENLKIGHDFFPEATVLQLEEV
jgi:hypothetical protein